MAAQQMATVAKSVHRVQTDNPKQFCQFNDFLNTLANKQKKKQNVWSTFILSE